MPKAQARTVRIFVVLIRPREEPHPYVFHESISGVGARQLARSLSMTGTPASVLSFDVTAVELMRLQPRRGQRMQSLQVILAP